MTIFGVPWAKANGLLCVVGTPCGTASRQIVPLLVSISGSSMSGWGTKPKRWSAVTGTCVPTSSGRRLMWFLDEPAKRHFTPIALQQRRAMTMQVDLVPLKIAIRQSAKRYNREADNMSQAKFSEKQLMEFALEEARKSEHEQDGRVHPWVGAVIARNDGELLAKAHRRADGIHAEVAALGQLRHDVVAGATIYTTLEPCTERQSHTPCSLALIKHGIRR